MEFSYFRCADDVWRPMIPIRYSYGKKSVSLLTLLDSGSDETILPIAIAQDLGIDVDLDHPEYYRGAGGGKFSVYRPKARLGFAMEHKGFQPICWSARVAFTEKQPTALMGHGECLERFNFTFNGPQKMIQIQK